MPGAVWQVVGGHQKGGVTTWVLMEGASGQRTPSHDYVLQKPKATLWSRHTGEQEKTHKPTHMVQVQGGSSEIKTRAHLECGVMRVIKTLTDANMSASFWWHNLYDHTHTHTHTHKQMGQSAAHLESASHRAPGQTWIYWGIWSIPSVLQFWPTPGPKGSYKLVRKAF